MGLQNPADPAVSPTRDEDEQIPPMQTASRARAADGSSATEGDAETRFATDSSPPAAQAEAHSLGAEVEKELGEIKSDLKAGGDGTK
jgi:hypothetical protein